MTTPPSPRHVFMSYSRKNEAVMQRIATFLRNQGINVWVDNEKLVPGTPIWEVEIEKAIVNAGAIIVLLSPDSKNSPWVRHEISYAEDNAKHIIPVLIAGNERNAIPMRLTNHQRIDIRQNEEVGLGSLSAELSRYLKELEAHEQRAREEAERLAREEAEREVAEKAAKEKALREAARQKAELEAEEKVAKEKAKEEHITATKPDETKLSHLKATLKNMPPLFWAGGIIGTLVLLSLGIWLATNTFKVEENGKSTKPPTTTLSSTPVSTSPSKSETSTMESAPASTQVVIGERAFGIHVTDWGEDINWDLVKDEGKDFVYIRVTRGETISNPDFYSYWEGAKLAGILRGASHSFDPDSDPIRQVENFIKMFKDNIYNGNLPPVLSVESTGNQSNKDFLSKLQNVLVELESKTGIKPIIQIESNFLEDSLRDQPGEYPEWLAQYSLWIVQYQYPAITGDVESRQPNLPDGCPSDWVFWGYSNIGVVPGAGSGVEMVLYKGSSPGSQYSQQSPETPIERAWGIDVSSWQGEIDWEKVKNSGVDFVYVRATNGTLPDSTFQQNWDTLRLLEIPRGAYLNYRSDIDPVEQIELFASQVDLLPGDLPPVLVIEEFGMESLGNQKIQSNLFTALSELERVTGIQPIIYSREGFFKSEILRDRNGGYPDWLTKHALWVAIYPYDVTNIEEQQPDLLNGWKFTWLFWQYTDRGTVEGIETPVDLNVYTGTQAELQQTFGLP